ncbi:GNAT family N-acetyltransferase [Methylococcus geothermalis]|uniref:GNAT family N-acetyltransferase n=2 Tax=Methylococcus geothermalis TaxID=2681310 RepID=A0A858QCF7_9GAMM|nr:GNAT family N-acetyltransferase [Methylococcus geothermalis]
MRKMFYLRSLAEHHGFRVCDPTCLGFPRRIVAFRKSGASRWRLVPLNVTHTEGCLSLFHKVFGTEMSRELWAWKYGDGRGRAMIACRGKEVVAHYGATTRRISFLGQETQALQICDVMVDPKERGVMTRRGVFFQVASAFLESYFGYENDHLLAYGFPNERAMRVAEKLQLYAEVGRVVEIRWPALPYRPHVATVLRRLWRVREEERSLGDLWSKMKRDLAAGILVMRDSNYLHYRYFEHPCFDYVVLVVANRLGGRLRGLIVLRRERDECKLVDLVAPLREIPLLIDHARRQVTRWGLPVLTAWVSATYAGFFRSPGVYKTGTEIPIPTNVWTEGPRFEELQDRWWFMMGDTDFL